MTVIQDCPASALTASSAFITASASPAESKTRPSLIDQSIFRSVMVIRLMNMRPPKRPNRHQDHKAQNQERSGRENLPGDRQHHQLQPEAQPATPQPPNQ